MRIRWRGLRNGWGNLRVWICDKKRLKVAIFGTRKNRNIIPTNKIYMSRILVTGGTGFIGSHTVVELQEAGYDVVIVDNLSNSKAEVVDNIEKITGKRPDFENFDLSNRGDVLNFFMRHKGFRFCVPF